MLPPLTRYHWFSVGSRKQAFLHSHLLGYNSCNSPMFSLPSGLILSRFNWCSSVGCLLVINAKDPCVAHFWGALRFSRLGSLRGPMDMGEAHAGSACSAESCGISFHRLPADFGGLLGRWVGGMLTPHWWESQVGGWVFKMVCGFAKGKLPAPRVTNHSCGPGRC